MKKIAAVLSLLVLASCITVEDYGDYWKQAAVDPALIGRWKIVLTPTEKENPPAVDETVISDVGGMYKAEGYLNGKKKDDAQTKDTGEMKSLKIGPYMFFVKQGKEKPDIMTRYKVEGTTAQFCEDTYAVKTFIEKTYPHAKNIAVSNIQALGNEAPGAQPPTASIAIKVLDKEVYDILASIPDGDVYWKCDTKYEKVQ